MNREFLKIKKFVEQINPNFKVHKSKEWSSLWSTGELWIPYFSKIELEGDKEYLDFIEKEYHFRPNTYIISLLHEIGHLETENQELSDNRAIKYASLEYAFENRFITREQLFNDYFKIEAEILATNWAVNYYKNNLQKIKKLIDTLKL